MRVSIVDGDRTDLTPDQCCHGGLHIYLDGVEQKECVMADEEAGVIRRYVWPLRPDEHDDDDLPMETVTGRVEIRYAVPSERWTGISEEQRYRWWRRYFNFLRHRPWVRRLVRGA